MKTKTEWTEAQVTRILTNPFYCGVRVDGHLIIDRPDEYDRAKFYEMAIEHVNQLGAQQCMLLFLLQLKNASPWTRCLRVHPSFIIDRLGIITELQFVNAGAQQINQGAKTKPLNEAVIDYFSQVIENLEHGK